MLNKIKLVFIREYMTRVRKKSFLYITLLAPLGFALLMIMPILFSNISSKTYQIQIIDEGNYLQQTIADNEELKFTFIQSDIEQAKKHMSESVSGILYLPKTEYLENYTATFYAKDNLGISAQMDIESSIEKRLRDFKIEKNGLDKEKIESLQTNVKIMQISIDENKRGGNTIIALAVSYILAIVMYMILLLYGTMVMKSITEEKQNRIVEILISTLKPFELLLGKILAVGAVGLTQFTIWIVTIPLLQFIVTILFSDKIVQMQKANMANMQSEEMLAIQYFQNGGNIGNVNITMIVICFLLFFFFGYLLYASIFAAIGCLVGDDGENQSLTFFGTLPIIISFILLSAVAKEPNSTISTIVSMIPFFSPILMLARVPNDIPIWQIILSLSILIATALFFIWLAGRIYRVGIMLYGTKIKPLNAIKWIFSKY